MKRDQDVPLASASATSERVFARCLAELTADQETRGFVHRSESCAGPEQDWRLKQRSLVEVEGWFWGIGFIRSYAQSILITLKEPFRCGYFLNRRKGTRNEDSNVEISVTRSFRIWFHQWIYLDLLFVSQRCSDSAKSSVSDISDELCCSGSFFLPGIFLEPRNPTFFSQWKEKDLKNIWHKKTLHLCSEWYICNERPEEGRERNELKMLHFSSP